MALFAGAALAANIGPQQCRRRLFSGAIFICIALALIGVLILQDAPWWWRLGALPLLWLGLLGLLQAREKT
ncbi:MAG: hypothetical protein QGH25_08715 [Candidatus Latescibacteria bacterium]|nr:hypothetical protein [Candidatus Latescibacterota bacterium]